MAPPPPWSRPSPTRFGVPGPGLPSSRSRIKVVRSGPVEAAGVFPVPSSAVWGARDPWNMKWVLGASELLGTDWASPWAGSNEDARGASASDPASEAGQAPAGGPETEGDPDPSPCPAAGACSAEGSGAGLAAGGGAGVSAGEFPGPSPAQPSPDSIGRILGQ